MATHEGALDSPVEAPTMDEVTSKPQMAKDEAPTVESVAFAEGRPFGHGLRAAREHLGIDLEEVSTKTKVRRHYLTAIEEMNLAQLPSRPFTEGYVRAYARSLGLDEGRAIARLRQDWPLEDEALPEPVGVPDEADPRVRVIAAAGVLVILAIVIWNVATRAMAEREPVFDADAIAEAPKTVNLPPPGTPVELGHPLPPPVEATLPPPYITPGLEPDGPPAAPAPGALIAAPTDEAVRFFQVKGKMYGAPPQASVVTLQATAGVFVILRRGDKVLEIQELKAGDAYRAPMDAGLAIDVTAPSALEVYVGGQYRGRLTQTLNQISALAR